MANDTKMRLLQCGLQLFKERGYNNVSVDDICQEAAITRSTFYYHYQTKDELLDSLYQTAAIIPEGDALAELLLSSNSWDKLWGIYEVGIDWTIELGHEMLSCILVTNLASHRNTFFPLAVETVDKMAVKVIGAGQKNKDFLNRSDPELLAKTLRTIIMGAAFEWCNKNGNYNQKKEIKLAFIALLDVDRKLYETKKASNR